jgi:hypothetical protein
VVLVILAAYLSATRDIRSYICVLLGRLLFVYLDSTITYSYVISCILAHAARSRLKTYYNI